ncbi:energy transducer TonB [Aquimarina mytili]|uniref:TonB C-terminal domain-containing protein n=1 Tax=Aquimarina mytili TaxID=874423 RepID=A0A937DCU7_9FLAO|nr:hypothetical protein [Aquimarina mytili]MBL0685331.1 hypothetical protein [Aquimarina mytili]
MQKTFLFTIVCVIINFTGNSQVHEEQEILLIKPTKKEQVYNNDMVDEKAIFKGGDSKLFKFYKNNSKFKIKDFEIPNKSTYFKLYIDCDGNVYSHKIIKSISVNHDKEVEKLVSLMPKWKPAKNNNKLVKVVLIDYITFQ